MTGFRFPFRFPLGGGRSLVELPRVRPGPIREFSLLNANLILDFSLKWRRSGCVSRDELSGRVAQKDMDLAILVIT